jgi:hypothetical protein
MASIEIEGRELVVRLHGWSKVQAMRGTIRVPVSHVRAVRAHPKEANYDDVIIESWRGVGTYTPNKVAAGVLQLSDGPSFFDVRDPKRVIAIDVDMEPIEHIVLQIDTEEPEAAVARLELALGLYRSAAE